MVTEAAAEAATEVVAAVEAEMAAEADAAVVECGIDPFLQWFVQSVIRDNYDDDCDKKEGT